MSKITIKAGSIVLEKKYNWFKRIWCKLIGKILPYNRYKLVHTEVTIPAKANEAVYVPIKNYNVGESKKLRKLVGNKVITNFEDIVVVINQVRPNTLVATETIDTNKYYKRVNG